MLTKQQIREIKKHPAYNYNVARSEESNCEFITNGMAEAGCHIIDFAETRDFNDLEITNGTLKECLDSLYESNKLAEESDLFTRTWYMKGL